MNENCIFIVVQLLSQVWLFATLRTAAHQASLSFTISQSLLQVMSTESVMPSSHLILCCPLLLLPVFSSIKSFPMSQFFALGGQSIWASASVLPMNIQGWFSLRLTGFISLHSKWILKSLLQLHSSKASVLWHSAFFIVQLTHLYMTTGKTIALTIWTFVVKVMPLLFNSLSRFVIAFLPK